MEQSFFAMTIRNDLCHYSDTHSNAFLASENERASVENDGRRSLMHGKWGIRGKR